MNYLAPRSFTELLRIKRLYKCAFPIEERKPFSIIRKMQKKGKTDLWYFEDNGKFIGMAATINGEGEILIDYFAVAERARGQGLGTAMLKALIEHYKPKGVFLEIEIPYEHSKNYLQRMRRKEFYLRAGLYEMGTRAKLFGVDMELLGVGCNFDFDEYRDFYLVNYGRFAYDNIEKIVN